jgi:hypothetical protein
MEKDKEILNKKIKKHPRKEKSNFKKPTFNDKMNKSNHYFNNKPDFDLLAIKYPDLAPQYLFVISLNIKCILWQKWNKHY